MSITTYNRQIMFINMSYREIQGRFENQITGRKVSGRWVDSTRQFGG